MGQPICGKHCGHFHYMISGGDTDIPIGTNLKFHILNVSPHNVGQLHFEYIVERSNDKIYFCFTYPYTYEMIQNDMLQLDILNSNIDYNNKDAIYCNREVITSNNWSHVKFI